jgi:hypothetical protein
MRNLLWFLPIAVFLLNPSFACSDEPTFQFGAAEMRDAVEGDWSFAIRPAVGAATQVTVHVDQAGPPATASARASGVALVRAAHACGTRTLVKSAGACIDVTEMPLAVTYVSGDAAFATAAMSGVFRVDGLTFGPGDLELMVGPYQIVARLNADGTLADPHLGPGGTTGELMVTRL